MDEHKEEIAALYALGALDPQEKSAFEAEMRSDEDLRKLVDDLVHHSAALTHALPARTAPPHLREKILTSVCGEKTIQHKVVPFTPAPASRRTWIPWAMAAGLAVSCSLLLIDRTNLQSKIASLKGQNDVCQMQVAMLDSMNEKESGVAVVVWDASTQTGVIKGRNMIQPAANQDYQIWAIDPKYPQPVSAGVLSVDEKGTAKGIFYPEHPVGAEGKFAISLERKGGVEKNEGPIKMMSK